MTGNHKTTSITRRRALAGGTVAAGGLAAADLALRRLGLLLRLHHRHPGGSAPAESEDGSTADDKTYLRGYQVANANGVVTFETIVPGWYTPPGPQRPALVGQGTAARPHGDGRSGPPHGRAQRMAPGGTGRDRPLHRTHGGPDGRRPPGRCVDARPARRGGGPETGGATGRHDGPGQADRRPPGPPRPAPPLTRRHGAGPLRRGGCEGRSQGRLPPRPPRTDHPRHIARPRRERARGPPERPAHGDVHTAGRRAPPHRGPDRPASCPGGSARCAGSGRYSHGAGGWRP